MTFYPDPIQSDALTLPDSLRFDPLKQWLRLADDSEGENALVESLALSGLLWAEGYCNRPLVARSFTLYTKSLCDGALPTLPPCEVTKVEYIAAAADWAELDAAEYETRGYEVLFSATAKAISDVTDVRITYTAGYQPESLPEDLRNSVLLFVGANYDNRADSKRAHPSAAEVLLWRHKLVAV